MKIQTLPIEQIKPYWANPRKNDAAVEAVASSIKQFGYVSPIIVDAENVIIAGHVRYRALLSLGIKHVDCVVVDLPPEKARTYRLLDNRLHEVAKWDDEKLMFELRELTSVAGDVLQDFVSYFPEIDHLVAPASLKITDEEIKSAEQQISESMVRLSSKHKSDEVLLTCPECGRDFTVSANDIINELKAKQTLEGQRAKKKKRRYRASANTDKLEER